MNQSDRIQAAADRLWEAHESKVPCDPIRDLISENDLDAAYKVQEINTKRKLESGERIVGAKIGLTSKAVQQQLGVDQPDFGMLTDAVVVKNGASISCGELMQPKIEAEVAFILSKDLSTENLNLEGLKSTIGSARVSLEIVGSRIAGWNIRIADTIADNASASHFVLGDDSVPVANLDLVNCKMTLKRKGEVVSEGVGAACMGNPLNAALWLAKTMDEKGSPLKKGDIILAGALGPMVAVNPGESFSAEIDGLGRVDVSFEE